MSPQMDSLQTIPLEQLCLLRDLYRSEWPKYAYTYYTLDNCYHWRTVVQDGDELCVFTDPERDWRSTGTFVLKDCKELFFCTLEDSTERLEWILGTVMDACGPIVSLVYDSCFRQVVDRIVSTLAFAKKSDERMVCYRQLVPCGEVQDGSEQELERQYRFSAVSPKDSDFVEEQWVHNDAVFTHLPTRLINRNPSLGVYDGQDRLVAWCLVDQTGSLAIFQTTPEHRRKGLGRAIIKRLSKQLHATGQLPQAYIVESNVASRSLFEQLDFNVVGLWYWTKLHKRVP
uniref:Glycine N-acyltransferase-like protein n=1 Tax=Anopheles epiroticus TaxID=199890 RepID=A0A182P497_9DIPT